jgi:alkylhydroperoxidase family enzyme
MFLNKSKETKMPRLRPIEDHEATGTQHLLIEMARQNGPLDAVFASICVRSEVGRNWLRYVNDLFNGGILPVPLKEMVRFLISIKYFRDYSSAGCSNIAKGYGLTEAKLKASANFEKSDLFDEREKAALRYAELFKAGDYAIDSDDVYLDLKKYFTEEEIIELAMVCAETDGVGKFSRSLLMMPANCSRDFASG